MGKYLPSRATLGFGSHGGRPGQEHDTANAMKNHDSEDADFIKWAKTMTPKEMWEVAKEMEREAAILKRLSCGGVCLGFFLLDQSRKWLDSGGPL